MPVRHNEDNYNEALLKLLPYQSSYLKNSLDSPYTKTNLLLQAHFSRTPLPIRDYNTDTKLLLDQAIRLIHCMIDLAAEKGNITIQINRIFGYNFVSHEFHVDGDSRAMG